MWLWFHYWRHHIRWQHIKRVREKTEPLANCLPQNPERAGMRCTVRWPPAEAVLPQVDLYFPLWIEGCTIQFKDSTVSGTFQPAETFEASRQCWSCISSMWFPQKSKTRDLVTTSFAHSLSTTAVMILLQVVKDNAIPENNKTKHTYKIFIQI